MSPTISTPTAPRNIAASSTGHPGHPGVFTPVSWDYRLCGRRYDACLERGMENEPRTLQDLVALVCNEYREIPRLRLTLAQVQRLWDIDADTTSRLLRTLIDAQILTQIEGAYVRASNPRHDMLHTAAAMAKTCAMDILSGGRE